ncbi:MAG: YlbF family regulator [Planctomycetia bacterium]
MSTIPDLTQSLAAALAADPRTAALKRARAALDASAADRKLQQRYVEALQDVEDLMRVGRPVEAPMKQSLAALEQQVRNSVVLVDLLRANAEFAQMMEQVSMSISAALDGVQGAEPHEHGPDCDHGDEGHGGHGHGDHGAPRRDEPPASGPSRIILP